MSEPTQLNFRGDRQIFYQLDWAQDTELLDAVRRCIEAQRAAAAQARQAFRQNPNATRDVSPEALEEILRAGSQINGIATEREISNCIAFNFANVEGAVIDQGLVRLRQDVDRLVSARLKRMFRAGHTLDVANSGHFWYPPGGYMSWHTNLRTPGWRLYINYADEPGKSFFRYRDPDTGEVITVMDRTWNFRLFKITPARPLWHAIYSDTNRFSVGYKVMPKPSLVRRVRKTLSKLMMPTS